MPLLFMSILARRLHPVVVASVDCMSSISAFVSITGEHVTNLLEHLPCLNETGIALGKQFTSLVPHWSSISRAWHHLRRKRDNGNVHRTAAKVIVS